MKGLLVSVYRKATDGMPFSEFSGDTTNGGISSKHGNLILVGDGIPEIFSATEHTPAIRLIKRIVFGKEFWIAAPLDAEFRPGMNAGSPYMFGGNFLYSSDSRFPDMSPIKIFDRKE
jgi:hypothetical protein